MCNASMGYLYRIVYIVITRRRRRRRRRHFPIKIQHIFGDRVNTARVKINLRLKIHLNLTYHLDVFPEPV